MFKDQKVLQKILDNTKPEYRDELKRVLDKLADEWHGLSDREKIQFAANGLVEFIYDWHEEEWENFPEDLSEIALEDGNLDWYYEDGDPNQDTVSDLILSYIIPEEDYIDPDNWYDTKWDNIDLKGSGRSEAKPNPNVRKTICFIDCSGSFQDSIIDSAEEEAKKLGPDEIKYFTDWVFDTRDEARAASGNSYGYEKIIKFAKDFPACTCIVFTDNDYKHLGFEEIETLPNVSLKLLADYQRRIWKDA